MKKRRLHSLRWLVPELFELIAQYLSEQYDMAMLLWALPPQLLSKPLKALQQLFLALYCGKLGPLGIGTTDSITLWPKLNLPRPVDDIQVIHWIGESLELYPHVELEWVVKELSIPQTTKVTAKLVNVVDIPIAMTLWPSCLTTLCIDILSTWKNDDVLGLCSGIELLPSLEKFDVTWKLPEDLFLTLLKAVSESSITKIAYHFDRDRGMVWNEEMVEEFALWLGSKKVLSAEFQYIRILEAPMPKFCRALLGSLDLTSLTVSDGTLARDLFYYGRLAPQLKTLIVHDAHYAGLPTITRLELTFRMSERRKDENISHFVAKTLPSLTKLRVVDLPHFAMTPTAYPGLIELAPQLEELNLESGQVKTLDEVLALAATLPKCHRLNTLKLCTPVCGERGAAAIASGLADCRLLEHLTLRGCRVGAKGAATIAGVLSSCPKLVELNLSSSEIGSDGATAIAIALRHCKSLKQLHLKMNGIESRGAVALSYVLPQLHVVDLGLNHIDKEGAIVIGKVLPYCVHLTWLSLHFNPLGLQGVSAIIAGTTMSSYRCGRVGVSYSVDNEAETQLCSQAIDRLLYPDWIVF
ncbi:hypothetical protein THRCLA_01324 [Thraustotheca clavata]|uniref:Uncharacterized protein n=1 Tax=Thraustotheca clavata TaxID=74557 RepID=A0A1W0A907_9STRA|nr:hypothetical protein THRCLA_01324 [Thraustotheca clavata]